MKYPATTCLGLRVCSIAMFVLAGFSLAKGWWCLVGVTAVLAPSAAYCAERAFEQIAPTLRNRMTPSDDLTDRSAP